MSEVLEPTTHDEGNKFKRKFKKLKQSFKKSDSECSDSEDIKIGSLLYSTYELPPEETLLIFDLHHVLFRPNYKAMAKVLWNYPNKKEVIKTIKDKGFANYIGKVIKGDDNSVPEHKMKELTLAAADKYKERYDKHVNPLVAKLCNCQDPDFATFELIGFFLFAVFFSIFSFHNFHFCFIIFFIFYFYFCVFMACIIFLEGSSNYFLIEQLKSAGYGIYILSNIGVEYFADLKNALENYFVHFDGVYTTNPDDDYIKKPHIKVFEK